MGAIFSRPVNYVKQKVNQKVEDTKTAIRNRIDNTKTAIYTKVDNTKNAITSRIDNATNAVTTRVNNTTTAVVTRVTDTRDAIVSKVNQVKEGVINFKDGVVRRVTNTYTAVKTRYDITKQATINAYTAVKTKYINTRDAVCNKYTSARNKTIDTYRRIRNAKLTRAQKIKYGSLLVFICVWLLIGMIILLDLYLGDYEGARWKVEAVQAFWCWVGQLLLQIMTSALYYTKVGGEYAWQGTKVSSEYAWVGIKICGEQLWEVTLIGSDYALYATQVCGKYLLYGTKVCAENVYHGLAVSANYTACGAAKAANYTIEGAMVAFEYGSYGAKEGAIYLFEGTKYLMVNLAVGSYHAAIHLVRVTRMCVWGLLTGSYSGSAMLMDGTAFLANKTYHGSMAAANYTYIAVTKTWEWTCLSAQFISHWSVVGAGNFWQMGSESVIYVYDSFVSGCIFIWESLCTAYAFICKWGLITVECVTTTTISVTTFIYTWGHYIIVNGSKGLYYGINQFGLKWLYSLGQTLAKWGGVLGNVFVKFFTDLGMYLWNFVYVTSMHIYNLLYIIFSFLYGILSAIMGLVRINVDGLVYCVKLVFRGIIWVLEETLVGYYYMLNKYNNYREWLFLGFLTLITLYCTGLIRDRRQSYSSDSENEDDDSEGEEPSGRSKEFKQKGSELPPIYEQPELPDYNDSSEDELLFEGDQEMNIDGVVESDELDLEVENCTLKAQKRAERISIGHEDSDALSDDSLETPESDRDKAPYATSQRVSSERTPGRSIPRKADLEADADDEGDLSDNDLDPESLSDVEQENQRLDVEDLPDDRPLYDRVAALIQSPASDSSRVSTPGSDFFAGHHLCTPGSVDSPFSVGTPASDFFAGHDLQNPAELDTPASDTDCIHSDGIFFEGHSVDTPASDISHNDVAQACEFYAGHNIGTPASDGIGTPASDFFAGHHLGTPGSLDTPASGIETPESDFFAGHHLTTPHRDIGTPSSDFSVGTPNSELERKGRRIFEHGLEGQSDLDSLEALPVSDSEPDSPVKSIRKSSLQKKIAQNISSLSDEESGDADCESDPETERTLKERVAAMKHRRRSYKEEVVLVHVDSENVESPMSPTSPVSTGSMDDERSCDTDSLQNLLVSESGDEADDSLKISSNMSDDVCEDSLGEDQEDAEDVMSTDSIPAGTATVVEDTSVTSPCRSSGGPQTFDNQTNLNSVFDRRSTLLAKEISGQDFDNTQESHSASGNDNQGCSLSGSHTQFRDSLSEISTAHLTTSDNGHSIPATDR